MNLSDEIRKQIEKNKGLKLAVGEINNHLSILENLVRKDIMEQVDEAYQKGLEEDKWKAEDGCTGCKWEGDASTYSPCERCCNCYKNEWTAKDDKIEVGDEVERYINGKLDSKGIYFGDTDKEGDYWNCLFWTGAVFTTLAYPKYQFKRTGRHFDIDKILEEMRE